jgi:protein-tyrosine phosphatase
LYIGRYRDTLDGDALRARPIHVLLHLAANIRHAGITTYYLPIEDGEPLSPLLLQRGLALLQQAHDQYQTVLIACGAGISRSAIFTIAALKVTEGITLEAAYHIVRHAHPETCPHPVLWDSLCTYFGETVSYRIILQGATR